MQYVNFVHERDDEPTLHTAPVPDSDAAYLWKAATHLKTLSEEQYMTGPAGIHHTAARWSYVLDDRDLYWCVEWDPGLIVVRMSAGAQLQWVALRSPVPNFGGREPLPEHGDPDEYDEDDNPQYNLVFSSWDAQFDRQLREWRAFVPANDDVRTRFEDALGRVNELDRVAESRYADNRDGWLDRCQKNLEEWCGEGVRLKPAS